MRSRRRMLVDLLLTRSNDQVRALIVPWSGVSNRSTGWWTPVAQHTIRERGGGLGAQRTRFAATPLETLTDPEGSVVSDGKSTAGVTAPSLLHLRRRLPHYPWDGRLELLHLSLLDGQLLPPRLSLFLSPVSVPWCSTDLSQMESVVPARSPPRRSNRT
jgi:hypothetical protein